MGIKSKAIHWEDNKGFEKCIVASTQHGEETAADSLIQVQKTRAQKGTREQVAITAIWVDQVVLEEFINNEARIHLRIPHSEEKI